MKSGELEQKIIGHAISVRASDIHIEPREGGWDVRLRIHGILGYFMKLDVEEGGALVQRLKVKGKMNISERRLPQDGSYTFRAEDGSAYDLRLATLPTIEGEKVSLRILYREPEYSRLDQLGFSPFDLQEVYTWLKEPMGLILITGPTGSGKTTTLYAILQTLNTGRYNICTIEDPIEFRIDGVNQVQVNEETGLTFSHGLRSLLRQDPDVIIIGEIRDRETADMAIRASLTGHLVLATLHTIDAATAITRLLEMGIEPYLVTTAVKGVIAQRLHNTPCPHCNGGGCSSCGYTGFTHRTPVFEVFPIHEELSPFILEKKPASEIRRALKGRISTQAELYLGGISHS